MKVLYYTDSLRLGGKERQLVELLKGLKQRDIKVLLVCMDRGEFYEPDVKALSIPLKYLFRKIRWDPLVIPEFYRLVREFKPDVIHTNSMMSSAYALPVAKVLGIPIINGSIRNAFQNSSLRWKVERTLLAWSDFRIANSMAGLQSRGFSPDSTTDFVIHNGFDLSRVQGLENQGDASSNGNGRGHDQVGMIAEFRPDKDFKTFFLAARRLLASRPNVTFLTVGDGETLDAMKALVADAGDRVQFLGRRKDVEKVASSFSVGVLATFTEGISNSIMEYMVLAKPVVATDCNGSKELILEGKTGFLVPPQDPAALADRIAYLLDHPDKARRMGLAGKKHIEESFSLETMVEKTVDIYEHAIRHSNGRGIRERDSQVSLKDV
ncbi:MAG TPA: glycosyltransferase [Terriglobales bacterium]|nr:glycosyltransferase [Terriglobales bacterium]